MARQHSRQLPGLRQPRRQALRQRTQSQRSADLPIHGEFRDFPPTILNSGTRDLLLSLTVLTHRKLRRAGVRAELQVYEGMSHCQYMSDPACPESEEAFTEISRFFDEHLES